jgi:hypothetical protein
MPNVEHVKTNPTVRATRTDDPPVIHVDHMKALIEVQTGAATIICYRYRPRAGNSKQTNISGNVEKLTDLEMVDDEAFLELKISLTDLYWFSTYIKDMVEDWRKNPPKGGMVFGPTGMRFPPTDGVTSNAKPD